MGYNAKKILRNVVAAGLLLRLC